MSTTPMPKQSEGASPNEAGPNVAGPNNVAERAFRAIRQAIVEGSLPPGSKISEPELSRHYGVSRGSLREAIGRLEACHLVERRANVGARVVQLTREGLLELYDIRESLEGLACRLAATHMPATEIKGLRQLLKEHQAREEIRAGRAYVQDEGDLDFHYRIVQGCGNQRLIKLLCDELYFQVRMYRYQFGMVSQRARRALQEHDLIIDAIADGDGELAELLMRRHIRASCKLAREKFAAD